jgi:N-acetylneuraminic acid mutarotase
MNAARANFAHVVLDNLVYVFGGISGRNAEPEEHLPIITNTIAEKYDPVANNWEVI